MGKVAATDDTPKKRATFLKFLRKYGNISRAAKAARIERKTAYRWKEDDETFAEEWKDALEEATDELELEARRRAAEGLERVRFSGGSAVMVPLLDRKGEPKLDEEGKIILVPYTEHEYSDTLLIFLLKAHRPDKFKDRVQTELSGNLNTNSQVTIYLPDNGRGDRTED